MLGGRTLATGAAQASARAAIVQGDRPGEHILVLCSTVGSPVDSRFVRLPAKHVAMTHHQVVVADDASVYVWQYR